MNIKAASSRPYYHLFNGLNVAYALFSVYVILYLALFFTFIKLPIYPTVNRITYFGTSVGWSLSGSLHYDLVIALMVFAASAILLFRWKISISLSICALSAAMASFSIMPYNTLLLYAIFIASLPTLLAFLCIGLSQKNIKNKILRHSKQGLGSQRLLVSFFMVFASFELFALVRWTIHPLFLDQLKSEWTWKINYLENNLFYAFGVLSPYLFILSTVSFPIKRYIVEPARTYQIWKNIWFNINNNKTSSSLTAKTQSVYDKISSIFQSENGSIVLMLLIAALPSVFLSLYSFFVTTPSATTDTLGTDVKSYLDWIKLLSSLKHDYPSLLYQAFIGIDDGARALSILTLFWLSEIFGSPETIIKFIPAILSPLLVTTVYFLTRTAYPEDRRVAVIASIMTAFSHQIVVGFYGAFYANWMAEIVILTALIFLLKALREDRPLQLHISLFALFALLSLFFHSYASSYFIGAIMLFLCWSTFYYRHTKRRLKTLLVLGIITLGIIGIDIVKSYYTNSTSGIQKDVTLAKSSENANQFPLRWFNLNEAFRIYVGGFLTNSYVLVLLLLWALLMVKYNNDSDRLLLSVLSIALLPLLFGDYAIQARLIYNIPFQIPASIIIYRISKDTIFGKPLFFALLFIQINYALRAMSNMQFIPPS